MLTRAWRWSGLCSFRTRFFWQQMPACAPILIKGLKRIEFGSSECLRCLRWTDHSAGAQHALQAEAKLKAILGGGPGLCLRCQDLISQSHGAEDD